MSRLQDRMFSMTDPLFHHTSAGGFNKSTRPPLWSDQTRPDTQRYLGVQLVVSATFGLSAFIAFCILRPKWTQLYNARKVYSQSAARLPDLPNTFFSWIPVLYRISNEEVLASAGLDAFAFLAFFRYAIKYLSITLFFALVIVLPVNYKYTGECIVPGWCPTNGTNSTNQTLINSRPLWTMNFTDPGDELKEPASFYGSFLWMYVVFAWVFTGIALYFLSQETSYIISIRQAYLGSQSTVTDRTIRLSGVPPSLQEEEELKKFVEELGIGKVDNIMVCKDWAILDNTVRQRMQYLRRLEQAWTDYLDQNPAHRKQNNKHHHLRPDNDPETTSLLTSEEMQSSITLPSDRARPKFKVRYGFLNILYKNVDAIDYFEEKLQRCDERVYELRKQSFRPTPLAYVTMESTAAAQMAVQARLDPVPGRLLATPAPPPADVVWKNTYLSRQNRMVRSWTIMLVTGFLTVFWAALLVPPAVFISAAVVDKFFPGLKNKDPAKDHPIAGPLISTTLPTLYFTLLSIGVPYLYDWLSELQGATSRSDKELSLISKNFFFVFFNLFVIFTVFSSVGQFYDYYKQLQDVLRETSLVAFLLAESMKKLWRFYTNLIMLQGLGLLPFRLLEFGSVALYPLWLFSARTPRDHAELVKPPVFQYGFYLPQSMLIFVICIVYSILPTAWLIILFGLLYFVIGSFVYKYQLLYAMEHQQHSTGRIWPMICNRIILGLILFQLATTGLLAARQALSQAVFMAPLIVATAWFTRYFQREYFPLMYFLALRSIDKQRDPPLPEPSESAWDRATDRGRAVDTDSNTGLRYMNPSLQEPLQKLWLRHARHPHQNV